MTQLAQGKFRDLRQLESEPGLASREFVGLRRGSASRVRACRGAQAASPAPVRGRRPGYRMGLVVQFAGLVPSSRIWSLNRLATSMPVWAPNTWMSNQRPSA
jgi:hypothetical protein